MALHAKHVSGVSARWVGERHESAHTRWSAPTRGAASPRPYHDDTRVKSLLPRGTSIPQEPAGALHPVPATQPSFAAAGRSHVCGGPAHRADWFVRSDGRKGRPKTLGVPIPPGGTRALRVKRGPRSTGGRAFILPRRGLWSVPSCAGAAIEVGEISAARRHGGLPCVTDHFVMPPRSLRPRKLRPTVRAANLVACEQCRDCVLRLEPRSVSPSRYPPAPGATWIPPRL